MKPVHLEFGPPSVERALAGRKVAQPAWAFLALALCAVLAIDAALDAMAARATLTRALKEKVARAAATPPASAPRRKPARPVTTERQDWNQIATRLNTPWSGLLDALEEVAVPEVALVSLEPDAGRQAVRLTAEARSLDALVDYAGKLRASPQFAQVVLLKHETREQDPNRPVRLVLMVHPAPATSRPGSGEGSSR